MKPKPGAIAFSMRLVYIIGGRMSIHPFLFLKNPFLFCYYSRVIAAGGIPVAGYACPELTGTQMGTVLTVYFANILHH
jgi:dihydrodipicolinate synthase/N-acetylneuraminate lyase